MRQRVRWPMSISDDDRRFFEELGGRIASLRNERGLTQAQLAASLGVSQQTINSFEKGTRRVPVSSLSKLSTTLHVSIEELLGGNNGSSKRGPTPKLMLQLDRVRELPRNEQVRVMELLDDAIARAVRRTGT